MRNACDSDSRCGLACDASTRDAKSLALWVERCEPLSMGPSPTSTSRKHRKQLGEGSEKPTRDRERVRKRFWNGSETVPHTGSKTVPGKWHVASRKGSKTVPKRVSNRFRTVFKPFSNPFEPFSNPFRKFDPGRVPKRFRKGSRTAFEPFSNRFRTLFEPFSNPFRTLFEPFSNPFRTLFEPFSKIRTVFEPFSNCFRTVSGPLCRVFPRVEKRFGTTHTGPARFWGRSPGWFGQRVPGLKQPRFCPEPPPKEFWTITRRPENTSIFPVVSFGLGGLGPKTPKFSLGGQAKVKP